ncbi:hypothetical protein I3842_01G040000 [Carya illinoinensis]|uniref:TraB domain-containing protein n=1 Tax=Carya illinoinensis TaxID=32201 RepID=A0A922FWG2_CARIL|nr:hypothetical protein I3842_01G040000 [Carya illinoinensis]
MFSLFSYKNPRYALSLPIFRAARKVSEEVGAQIVLGDHPIEITVYDSTFRLNEQLSFSYPSLLQPLMHKRDTYLALSLKRSKALNNNKKVVGLIGKGHMNGVIYELISDQGNLRFRDLAGKRPDDDHGSNRCVDSLFKSLVRDTVIGIMLWALYEQLGVIDRNSF